MPDGVYRPRQDPLPRSGRQLCRDQHRRGNAPDRRHARAWEQKLAGLGLVGIHRSRLVNKAKIGALQPTASGDFEVTIGGRRTLQGSRRFRAGLG
nr:LytTR family DNA-binding domain-containing protein [Hyphomonas sp.]